MLTYLLFPGSIVSTILEDNPSAWQPIRDFLLPGWIDRVVSFLICATIGYFPMGLSSQFSTTRMKAPMQTTIHFLLVTVCLKVHYLYTGNIAVLGSLISIYFLFKNCQQTRAVGYLFYFLFFIGAESTLSPRFAILSVFWLLETYHFQSPIPRSFCGTLLEWMLPYWMLFGHASFYNEMELFHRPFNQLLTIGEFFNLRILQPQGLTILGYLLVIFIINVVHCIATGSEDKIRTRTYLRLLIGLTIPLFLSIALQSVYYSALLPSLIISNGILIEHLFVLTNGKSSNVLLIISPIGPIPLFAFNIWMFLQTQRYNSL